MDRQWIRDHQIMERYLQGKLSDAEEQAFEEAYLADPELVRELELVERLREAVKSVRPATEAASEARRGAWWKVLASPQYALAASVLLVIALASSIALYVQNLELRSGASPRLAMHTRLVPLVAVRGGNANAVTAPRDDEWTVLLIDPGLAEHRSYRVMVMRTAPAPAAEIWTADNLMPGYEEQLAVGLPGRLLEPGRYELTIEGRTPAGAFQHVNTMSLSVEPLP